MASHVKADDWEVCSVAQVGAAGGLAAGLYLYRFRSKKADFLGDYLFVGGGGGAGGSMGGGSGPSPVDVARNRLPNLWTSITCHREFSGDDLNWAYASLSTLAAAGAYGYALTAIRAGAIDTLFKGVNVSGWGTGVGVIGATMVGVWKRIGSYGYF